MICYVTVRTRTPHWHFADSDVLGTVTYRDRYIPFYELAKLNQKYSGSESAWQASTTGMPVPRCRGGYRDILQNIIMTHCTQYILVLEKLEKYVLRVAGLGGTY